ncbi:hypothetical protein DL96DRAFT_1620864 [Flagelloscypha sp. PMI_526]|nr:hypothetical protein DL96DRAFT_1620864 [Flagelloscypha sp. PMI_526]
MPVSGRSLPLPPELWHIIFNYLSKSEILVLRIVSKIFSQAVPERYSHPQVLDLTWPIISNYYRKSALSCRKSLRKALKYPSKTPHGQWYSTLRITPHIENVGSHRHGTLDRMKCSFSEWIGYSRKESKILAHTLCTQTLPSIDAITALAIVEGFPFLRAPKGETTYPRCTYLNAAWSLCSAKLTTLEITIYFETQWPSYRPADDISFPSLSRLRVEWCNATYWPNVPAILASKAPNLEELEVSMSSSLLDDSILPKDPQLLPLLKTFNWSTSFLFRSPYGWLSSPPTYILSFLKAFKPQLKHISIQTWDCFDFDDEDILDISNLHSLSLGLFRGCKSIEINMLEQLEAPGFYSSLQELDLNCSEWRAVDVERLFDALVHLQGSLWRLLLYLPSYSTSWLTHISRSTPSLESLHLVIKGSWSTEDGQPFTPDTPYSLLVNDVVSASTQFPELLNWRLRDITIKDSYPGSLNTELMRAIASVVTTIYSFRGRGNMELERF